MLERPWHKRREHEEEPLRAWQDSQPADTGNDVEPRAAHETGELSELVETEAVA